MTLQGTQCIVHSISQHLWSTHSVQNGYRARITKREDELFLRGIYKINLVEGSTLSLPSGNSQTVGGDSISFLGSPSQMGEKGHHPQK